MAFSQTKPCLFKRFPLFIEEPPRVCLETFPRLLNSLAVFAEQPVPSCFEALGFWKASKQRRISITNGKLLGFIHRNQNPCLFGSLPVVVFKSLPLFVCKPILVSSGAVWVLDRPCLFGSLLFV